MSLHEFVCSVLIVINNESYSNLGQPTLILKTPCVKTTKFESFLFQAL